MKFTTFALLALVAASAVASVQADVLDQVPEVQPLENPVDRILQQVVGDAPSPGTYASGASTQSEAAPRSAAANTPVSCPAGQSPVSYTTTSTKFCVLRSQDDTQGIVYSGINGEISVSQDVQCFVTECTPSTTGAGRKLKATESTNLFTPWIIVKQLFGTAVNTTDDTTVQTAATPNKQLYSAQCFAVCEAQ